MIGKFYKFNPKGTYFSYPGVGEHPPGPSTIKLSTLSVHAGDYIALRGNGSWTPGTHLPAQQRVSGVFRSSRGGFIPPAPAGQESQQPFDWWPPNTGEAVFSITQDFNIPYNKTVIVRVPTNAVDIALNSGDWKFQDNEPVGTDCGVYVSFPNRKTTTPTVKTERQETTEEADVALEPDEADLMSKLADIRAVQFPNAASFSVSPFAKTAPDSKPHWRGWYRRPGTAGGTWLPTWSHWRANRNGTTHWGWDIFSPIGTKVVAPVGPCYVQFMRGVVGYGNVVALRFTRAGVKYSAIYGHCDDFIGTDNRVINMGDDVAHTGCSGNAGAELCGTDFTEGGRSDHVHVGLYQGQDIGDSYTPLDPGTIFPWNPV